MGAVTLLAIWSVLIVLGHELAMNTLLMLLRDLSMASAAVHRAGNGFTRATTRRIDLGVALAAGNFGVP